MIHHTITVQKTAHYYTLGTPGPQIKQLWIVCHGYAQTADEFLANFNTIADETRLIVAPEALNTFYKKGFSGDVGAVWMTKRHREAHIQDYSGYLQTLYDFFVPQLHPEVRVTVLGFSQGAATVTRWVMAKQPKFNDLLLWAGLPPEDLDYKAQKEYLSDKNLYLLYGSSDPFLTPEHLDMVTQFEVKNEIDFDERPFTGGHEIPSQVLKEFILLLN